jgi:hypothetical protein
MAGRCRYPASAAVGGRIVDDHAGGAPFSSSNTRTKNTT